MSKNYKPNNKSKDNKSKGKSQNYKKEYDNKPKDDFLGGIKDFDKEVSNNIAYYNQNPIQFGLATQAPTWAQIQGEPYKAGSTIPVSEAGVSREVNNYDQTMPGVMVLHYLPTPGISKDAKSALNKALNALMSELYAKTTANSLGFQQADLSMYVLSMSSIASLFAVVKRMLDLKDFYVAKNTNYPRILAQGMGVTYDDIITNYNQHIIDLNNAIGRFNEMKVPAWFHIFSRQYALAKNVYLDEDSEFGQIFFYQPEGVFRYVDTEGVCRVHKTSSLSTVQEWIDLLNDCLDDWNNSSVFSSINGALIRTLPNSAFVFIEPYSKAELNPVVDEYLALQCMNATICYKALDMVDAGTWDITQEPDKNALIFNPRLSNSGMPIQKPDGLLMRAFKKSPTPEDNMEMTRLSVHAANYQLGDDDEPTYEIISCGTEVITRLTIHGGNIFHLDDDRVAGSTPIEVTSNAMWATETNVGQVMRIIRGLSPFRFIPRISFIYEDPGVMPEPGAAIVDLGDIYNYSFLANKDLDNLHNTALFSIWKPMK